jgi:hypothetical protein
MQWNNIFVAELIFVGILLVVLGLVKLPRFFRRKKLQAGSPWGYYSDAIPKADPGYCAPDNKNYLYNTACGFGPAEGGSEQGQFAGFGELGEYGQGFIGGQD